MLVPSGVMSNSAGRPSSAGIDERVEVRREVVDPGEGVDDEVPGGHEVERRVGRRGSTGSWSRAQVRNGYGSGDRLGIEQPAGRRGHVCTVTKSRIRRAGRDATGCTRWRPIDGAVVRGDDGVRRCSGARRRPTTSRTTTTSGVGRSIDDARLFEKLCARGLPERLVVADDPAQAGGFRKAFAGFDSGARRALRPSVTSRGCSATRASSAIGARSRRRSPTRAATLAVQDARGSLARCSGRTSRVAVPRRGRSATSRRPRPSPPRWRRR